MKSSHYQKGESPTGRPLARRSLAAINAGFITHRPGLLAEGLTLAADANRAASRSDFNPVRVAGMSAIAPARHAGPNSEASAAHRTLTRPEPWEVLQPVWTRVAKNHKAAHRSVTPHLVYGELIYLVAFAAVIAWMALLIGGAL